ncbi:4'-phosphopantetheinyl transferase superfamily protein [uncultured Flavobacterium sp.]|uniref:4'-phosphopantetheinyl transferase family protein n=1 Tax=uncultured Flavobacterium sp. TaxID=165435 RepID=UPI0030ED93C3|tara:strand:+ start:13478 stop:14125 length:648 start_codon:yes stop_codon:yes gene_type:complete
MPLHKIIYLSNNTKLYLWKITENLDTLSKDMRLKDSSIARLESMKSESHKKGFLSVRKLLEHIDYNDFDLYYDEFGKPNLKPQGCSIKDMHISISHSHDFSAIAISEKNIGIDIEILKDKIVTIAPKFMDITTLENLSSEDKIKKATVIWGIKESIFKIKNEPGISFPNHIFEENFKFEDKKTAALLKFNNKNEKFYIEFDSFDGYMFVCAFENN